VRVARLLVVEDDETIGAALTSSLREHGHPVAWEQRGYALRGKEFDLLAC
jgi:DNA-binding response OmpR family regulator